MSDRPSGKKFSFENTNTLKAAADNNAKSNLNIDGGKVIFGGWTTGTLKSNPEYSFHAKAFAEPSKFGIDGGKISKLDLRRDGVNVARFDRGWVEKPKSAEDREAVTQVRQGLGDETGKSIKAFVKRIGSGKDHSRGR